MKCQHLWRSMSPAKSSPLVQEWTGHRNDPPIERERDEQIIFYLQLFLSIEVFKMTSVFSGNKQNALNCGSKDRESRSSIT